MRNEIVGGNNESFLCMLYYRFLVFFIALYCVFLLFSSYNWCFPRFNFPRICFLSIDLWLLNSGILLLPLSIQVILVDFMSSNLKFVDIYCALSRLLLIWQWFLAIFSLHFNIIRFGCLLVRRSHNNNKWYLSSWICF